MRLILAAALLAPAVAFAAPGVIRFDPVSAKLPPTYRVTLPRWHNPKWQWDMCFAPWYHGKRLTMTVKVNGHVVKAYGEVCLNMPNKPKDAH